MSPADLEQMVASVATHAVGDEDAANAADESSLPEWMPVRFDHGTAKDDVGVGEREIITYCGSWQLRWSVKKAQEAWEALDNDTEGTAAPAPLYGVATSVGGAVFRHVTVKDDLDVVAIGEDMVKSLRF